MSPRKQRFLTHLRHIQLLAFLCGLPGFLAAIIILLVGDYPTKVYSTVIILVCFGWFYFAIRLQNKIIHPLQTASNMLSALREGDFSIHPSYITDADALGQLMLEIKLLTKVLSEHRMIAMEAHSLLDKILQEVDAAVFAFDPNRAITLANPAALRLLNLEKDDLLDHYAAEFNLDAALEAQPNTTITHPLDEHMGRFTVRKGSYRVDGEAHSILILIDVSRTLRDEELLAWKRIIRVLGHELNNSMTPIRSLAQSLKSIAKRPVLDDEDREDLNDGLDVIYQRADSLTRFINDYARLAKLPKPSYRELELLPLVERLTSLFNSIDICIDSESPNLTIHVDPDQLEQALLNLIKNAAEAAQLTNGKVTVCWHVENDVLVLHVEDTGPGIANPDNLFIPFFSTKKGGSGIGLTLSRQIIEGHDGRLELSNREDVQGCLAKIILPVHSDKIT